MHGQFFFSAYYERKYENCKLLNVSKTSGGLLYCNCMLSWKTVIVIFYRTLTLRDGYVRVRGRQSVGFRRERADHSDVVAAVRQLQKQRAESGKVAVYGHREKR